MSSRVVLLVLLASASLALGYARLHIEVRDDGRGLGEREENEAARFGIMGMRERVQALNGELELSSAGGEGLSVQARIPVAAADPAAPPAEPVESA